MPTVIESSAPTLLAKASLAPRSSTVHPSPADWRDQILYFLLPDRFSDGNEGSRSLFDRSAPTTFKAASKAAWMAGGKRFQGGKIAGITKQLPYLRELGVTTLWIGPVWKQRKNFEDYHGYGIQNFLEVDPRFGTRAELRQLVDSAHVHGMYVLLDIIYNHSGNNFFYEDAAGAAVDELPYRFAPAYASRGWRTPSGSSIATPATIEDGVWPSEFQNLDFYTRAGKIGRWDPESWEDPRHPNNEFRRGDFGAFKDLRVNELEENHGAVLDALINVYRYWIALTDCDGFRIDTVKHVQEEASRNFCGGIREYAERIGKENFLLLGEVAGGASMARNYVELFGRNLDAALDLGDPPKILAAMAKGQSGLGGSNVNSVTQFFTQFGGHDALGSHREVGRYHVSVLDDHDMIGRGKLRFSAQNSGAARYEQAAHVVGIQLTTLGIPCIYYGTEQAFDGGEHYHDDTIEPRNDGKIPFDDRYVRESMFGGNFGAFETDGCHFFDTKHPTYERIAAIARVVRKSGAIGMTLRRGRQYAREIRVFGPSFGSSSPGEVAAWSRLMYDTEVLIAVNTHGAAKRGADVTIDAQLHAPGSTLNVLYRGDWTSAQLKAPPAETVTVLSSGGRAFVRIDLPAAGMVILG